MQTNPKRNMQKREYVLRYNCVKLALVMMMNMDVEIKFSPNGADDLLRLCFLTLLALNLCEIL